MVKSEVINPRSSKSTASTVNNSTFSVGRLVAVLAVAVVAGFCIILAQDTKTSAPGRSTTPANGQPALQVKPLSDRSAAAATTSSSSTIQSASGNSQTSQVAPATQYGPAATPSLNTSANSNNTVSDQAPGTNNNSIGL